MGRSHRPGSEERSAAEWTVVGLLQTMRGDLFLPLSENPLSHCMLLSSGKPGGDAVSCWRPSWQNPVIAKGKLQLEALEGVRVQACSFLTFLVSRATSQAPEA